MENRHTQRIASSTATLSTTNHTRTGMKTGKKPMNSPTKAWPSLVVPHIQLNTSGMANG